MERFSRKGGSRPCQSNAATAASKKEIDERRLRKLKVYLRSVTYNSCEGLPKFPTLPDHYEDTILSEEFPCDTMKLASRQHCAPTPFLIACCFNRRYPVNARKRAGNMRSKPLIKQNIDKFNSAVAREKNIFPKTGSTVSCEVQTSKTTKSEKVNTPVAVKNLLADSTTKREKAPKIFIQDNSAENEKHYGKQRPNSYCCKSTVEETTKWNCGGKTGKIYNSETGPETESYCGLNHSEEDIREKLRSEGETSEVMKLGAKKMMVKESERTETKKEHVCGTKAGSTNKHCGRSETGKESTSDLEICLTEEDKEPRPAKKGNNQDSYNGTSSVLCNKSSCHTSVVQIKPEHSTFKGQELDKNAHKTGKVSQTAIIASQKTNTLTRDDEVSAYQSVEMLRTKRYSPRKQQDEDNITSNISTDPSRRTSPRLVTSCNRHNKAAALQDKERGLRRRDAWCAAKMKLKVSENANNRLRSRAVIKQPGHEKRYTKSRQTRAK